MIFLHIKFAAPLWAGSLPTKVGEPAGGSLTADEYKFATTVPFAIAVRHHLFTYYLKYIGCRFRSFGTDSYQKLARTSKMQKKITRPRFKSTSVTSRLGRSVKQIPVHLLKHHAISGERLTLNLRNHKSLVHECTKLSQRTFSVLLRHSGSILAVK